MDLRRPPEGDADDGGARRAAPPAPAGTPLGGRMRQRLPSVRGLLKGPRRLLAAAAAVVVLAGAGTWTAAASGDTPPVHRTDQVMAVDGVRLDTSFFTPAGPG